MEGPRCRRSRETHPSNSPPLGLIRIIEECAWVAKHLRSELWRQMLHWQAMVSVAEDLRRLVHERRRRLAHRRVETAHVVVHGGLRLRTSAREKVGLRDPCGLSRGTNTKSFLTRTSLQEVEWTIRISSLA